MTKFLNISTDNTLGGNSPSDETVSSQKAIKEYVDNHGGSASADGVTINTNSSDELQAIGLINKNPASGATNPKYDWVGTLQEYETQSVATAHPEWICYITDDAVTSSNGRCIGEIVTSTIPLEDAGLHLLDGSLIANGAYAGFVNYISGLLTDYPDLFCSEADWQSSVTTYGVCGKFVYDSVNNTVRLPKITGFTEGTIDPTVLGDLTEAGLPNITGQASYYSLGGLVTNEAFLSGCFSRTATAGTRGNSWSGASSTGQGRDLLFDASLSNSIYGNSSTVQPQAIKVLYYIVIATSAKTDIEVDIDEIATDLNGKADVDYSNALYIPAKIDLSNSTTATLQTLATVLANIDYVVESQLPTANNNYTWYRVYKSGWLEQGGKVTGNITFPKPYSVIPTVTIGITSISGSNNFNYNTASSYFGHSLTTTGFNCGNLGQYWEAKGMGVQS